MRSTTKLALVLALLTPPASAQFFVQLPGVELRALSGDGTTVIGRVGGTDTGLGYDFATGTLTQLPEASDLRDLSRDGSLACGSRLVGAGIDQRATVWGAGPPSSLPIAPGSCPIAPFVTSLSVALDLDGAGTLAVGRDCLDAVAWSLSGNVRTVLPGTTGLSIATCVSRDGTTIGGLQELAATPGSTDALLWRWNATTSAWDPPVTLLALASVQLLSADGRVAVLRPGSTGGPDLALWHEGAGIEPLPSVAWSASPIAPEPTGLTWDGRMVVGTADGGGFVWTRAGGMQRAEDFLDGAGIRVPSSWSPVQVRGVSDDGRVLWGHSANSSYESWIAWLRSWHTYGEAGTPPQSLRLDGVGTTSLGGTFTLRTTGVASAAPGTARLVSRAPASVPVAGGLLLVDPFPGGSMPVVVDPVIGGISDADLAIPNDQTLLERTFYAQTFAADPAQVAGWAFSNGLRFTLGP